MLYFCVTLALVHRSWAVSNRIHTIYCAASAVRATQASSSAVSEYLAIVKAHRGSGSAELVAFVSLTGTKDGLPPWNALCSCNGATSGVPFSGKFTFYTQDLAPPQVPASLTAKGTFVQVVFLEGKMKYKFTGGKWNYLGFFATMADVAGGAVIGNVGTISKPDRHGSNLHWHFKDPNGFWLSGQLCSKPVQMSADGCPWQLMKITSSGGTVWVFFHSIYVSVTWKELISVKTAVVHSGNGEHS